MSTIIPFPASLKNTMKQIAMERKYPVVIEVLDRGTEEELILNSQTETQALIDVARIEMLNASLKYPFWDEDSARYDKAREDAFQEIQMGLFPQVSTISVVHSKLFCFLLSITKAVSTRHIANHLLTRCSKETMKAHGMLWSKRLKIKTN